MSDYIDKITATDGTTYDIKDTVSGYITSFTDEKLKLAANTGSGTFYPVLSTATTTAENKKYDTLFTCVRASSADAHIGIGSNGTAKGSLRLYTTTTGKYGIITPDTLTDTRTYTLPDKTGTIALTSDLSSFITDAGVTKITTTAGVHTAITNATGAVSFNVPTKTSHLTNDSGFLTSTVSVANGGTGATTAAAARSNLGLSLFDHTSAYGGISYMSTAGVLEVGKYIDFHATAGSSAGDYDFRVTASTSGLTMSGPVFAAASAGTTAQVANVKYGSSAPSGTATTGTVYFQTGSSAYTFQSRVNLSSLSASTTQSTWTSFTLPTGLYLITFQVNCGSASTYILRVDLLAGSNTITQVRTASANSSNLILNGAGLVECTSSTTMYFKAITSSGSISNCELHYSYVKLF